jgi:NDP-sugar pyrophosphorylase family protein
MQQPPTRPRQAVVLAAGEGSRLSPLTELVPKPMLPIDGQAVVERVLGQLVASGVERATIVVGHLAEALRTFVDRLELPLEVAYVEQGERRGTAHALQLALAAGLGHADTVVAASDTWWRDEDVAGLVDGAAADRDALVTMALLRWPVTQLPHHSAVQLDDVLCVRRVLHRVDPDAEPAGASALSGSPLYVFRAEFWERVAAIEPSPSGVVELATGIQRAIDDGELVRGFEVAGARDLTRPGDLLRHNFAYLAPWLDAANPSR